MNKKLISLGFDNNFVESLDPQKLEQHGVARITAVHKDSYTVTDGEVEVAAELVGKLLFNASATADYPAVGDWVLVSFYDEMSFAIIHEILPRKSLLKRKTAGKKIDFQIIAANIDVAFVVQSLNENFNIQRLERYLVMIYESNIKPIILLSKSDLLSNHEIELKVEEINIIMPQLKVVHFSNEDEEGLKNVDCLLEPALTYCLLGSSGVGKTTLINKLIGKPVYETKTISTKEGKGRHTTTRRQLVKLANGAMLIDTPGMRELGNFSIETGFAETFSEIARLSEDCYFNDCTHENEKGCAILEAIKNGQVSAARLKNYRKMTRESDFHEMSYLEKKNKDKQFGKMCKNVMKHKKNVR
jgi:ribosome biogenesis GTPase / thiamine phosphate phosphatase